MSIHCRFERVILKRVSGRIQAEGAPQRGFWTEKKNKSAVPGVEQVSDGNIKRGREGGELSVLGLPR